ncbi:DNA-binding response regulator [Flexivirga endophytica]|uniref:DNA-binding response regulator n=1 Tax=Flexivirga endophytica TaxID=1849103 RepID=A0A916WSF0_9MICO|nr:response regulator transcription factor [Flexivirga endophytica]GGB25242.1 DNA-binding response regulator [Flexivirga endophytica]GHB53815.1 DNA-binding response regulator [Flexivirga endophytica]
MTDTGPISVLIVDDHPMFREGLRFVLSAAGDIEVVGEAASGQEAVDLALELQPDVVIMDLAMPGMLGIEATRAIVTASPHIGVLALTMFDDDTSVFGAMRAGARGYLLKGADHAVISQAIRSVARGEVIVGSTVAAHIQQLLASPAAPAAFPGMTAREQEVLELIARGRDNARIARALGISGKTVRNHVSNVFTKLQVADRAAAIVRAREAGIGVPGGREHPTA